MKVELLSAPFENTQRERVTWLGARSTPAHKYHSRVSATQHNHQLGLLSALIPGGNVCGTRALCVWIHFKRKTSVTGHVSFTKDGRLRWAADIHPHPQLAPQVTTSLYCTASTIETHQYCTIHNTHRFDGSIMERGFMTSGILVVAYQHDDKTHVLQSSATADSRFAHATHYAGQPFIHPCQTVFAIHDTRTSKYLIHKKGITQKHGSYHAKQGCKCAICLESYRWWWPMSS